MPRQRTLCLEKQQALIELWPTYGLALADGKRAINKAFGHSSAPLLVEIGFGMGDALLAMARNHPAYNFIGIEVHRPGIGTVFAQLEQQPLANIRIYEADAIEVLQSCMQDESVDQFMLFFPDPWPKRRHHKRRIIQPSFVNLMHAKLKPGGILHIATDWEDYAQHILKVLTQNPGFKQTTAKQQLIARPTTKFEVRGKKLQHKIWDYIFVKTIIKP